MQLFKISQSDKQLVLSFEKGRQLTRLALYTIGVAICGVTLPEALDRMVSGQYTLLGPIFFLYFLFLAGRELFRVMRGNVWVFDVEKDLVIHNGKTVSCLKDIQSVQTWEESGDEGPVTRHFGLQDVKGKMFVISNEISGKEWAQAVEAARQISAFTSIQYGF